MAPVATSESQQGLHYSHGYDYVSESPHLKHRHLHDLLAHRIAAAIPNGSEGCPSTILEIGAGDGSMSERLLALGFDLTATEMSDGSVQTLEQRFGRNDRFHARLDAEGDLEVLGNQRFDAVLFASVLHHIPDYEAAIDTAVARLRPGGSLISVQDPLWYPRTPESTLWLTNLCFLSWRITRGNLLRGVNTRIRRKLYGLSEEAPGDVVEYHVVRDGVDEEAIRCRLEPSFENVEVLPYWSSQGTFQQRLGERLGRANTFAIFATGLTGQRHDGPASVPSAEPDCN